MRQRGAQSVNPGRRISPGRLGPPPRRYSQVSVQAQYSPQTGFVNEEPDAMDDDTDNIDDDTDSTDDDSFIGPDIVPMDISFDENVSEPIPRIYDGAEELDHESEDHTVDNHTSGHLMSIEGD